MKRISREGFVEWIEDRRLAPSAIWDDGRSLWYRRGFMHREDGPAILESDGAKQWYRNGIKRGLSVVLWAVENGRIVGYPG